MRRLEKKKRKDKEKIDKFFESRQKKVNNFTYFAQPLESICEPGSYVPVFIDKCIEFVENAGKSRTHDDHDINLEYSDCVTSLLAMSRDHCKPSEISGHVRTFGIPSRTEKFIQNVSLS